MKVSTLFFILIATFLLTSCQKQTLPPPNIVFILADDLGYSDLGCYGAEIIETPHIDALAEDGLRFTNFYNTGRCWPTRTSLLSGFYPHQVLSDEIVGVDYAQGNFQAVNETWLPALLKTHGYRTYHSGKWHLFRRFPKHIYMTMDEVGFDRSYQTEDGRHLRPVKLHENGELLPPLQAGTIYEASTAIVDHGIKYLHEHKDKHAETPFFQYLAFITPHFPLQALQKDIDQYREKFLMGWNEIRELRTENRLELGYDVHEVEAFEPERFAPWNLTQEELIAQIDANDVARAVPWNSLTEEQKEFQATKMAIHAAMITRMDREIGRYMEELNKSGYMENTIVFFCSDNGASTEMMNRADKHTPGALPGAADSYVCLGPGWSTAANTPFRLHKTWLHEGGISTPLVVHWPAGIKDQGVFRKMNSHIVDIAPTLLELAGGDASELNGNGDAPGISLLPFLNEDVQSERPPIFFQHDKKSALRHGDWKITTIEMGGAWELYDLSTDRGETHNLARENPVKLKEMVQLWESQREAIVQQIRIDSIK